MASVKFKNLEVGHSYTAMIWQTSSQKEPVEVKIENFINEATGIRVVTDKFDVVQERGAVIHSETGKRVTFRTIGDAPAPAVSRPSAPKSKKERDPYEGWNIPRPDREPLPNRLDSVIPLKPAEGSGENTQHDLIAPSGRKTYWTWANGHWTIFGPCIPKSPKWMAAAGYKYVGPRAA